MRRLIANNCPGPTPNVRMKNASREAMVRAARAMAGVVRSRVATTAEQQAALGLRVARPARRRAPRPAEAPVVQLGEVGRAGLRVRLMQKATGRCAKPAGVTGAVLMYATGAEPPTAESGWRLWRVTGAPRRLLGLPGGAEACNPSEKFWVTACWLNERGEPGPWATPAGRHVGFVG